MIGISGVDPGHCLDQGIFQRIFYHSKIFP